MKLSHGIINYLKLKETAKQEISKIKNTKKKKRKQKHKGARMDKDGEH